METAVVPLHVLDTDVDIVVSGEGATEFAQMVAERWHLAVSEVASAAGEEAGSEEAGPEGTRPGETGQGDTRPGETGKGETRQDEAPEPVTVTVELTASDSGSDTGSTSGERRRLQRLTQQVTRAVIEARTGDLLMLHAGALSHATTGAAVAFVAPGGTGKSTLCTVQGPGRAYLTDETVGIRRDGTIAPYLKPISTRRPDWSGVKDEVAPGGIGLRPPTVSAQLAGIVLLRREDGWVGAPEVTVLDTLTALTEIAPETSGFSSTHRPLTWLAELLEETGGARRVSYATADQLGPLVDSVCGAV